MSERKRKLFDLLVICVLRYGQTQDNRFALASLVTCQALQGVPRGQVVGYVEGKLTELQERVIALMAPHSKADESYAVLAAFVRSMGLAKALGGEKARLFDSDRARTGLRRLAPELADAIDAGDVRLAYNFLKLQHTLRAA
ncbi:hypothetical protein WOC76_05540 [Methylocystis sp. IM3]|jgi:hypothetical protein|uniref:hypothetical protein n=1 Tax=unclassified Methylocystis TaxID=2625913 RepID=UPI0030FBCECE